MKTNTIYYSSFNIDSTLAALIFYKYLKVQDDTNVTLIKYDRTSTFSPCQKQDKIFIVGADISPLNMVSLCIENTEAEINIVNYPNSEKYNNDITAKLSNDYTKLFIDEHEGHLPNSLSEVVVNYLKLKTDDSLFESIFFNTNKTNFFKLLESITKYCNFILMTQEETLLVFKNIDNIYNTLESNDDFNIIIPVLNDDKEYIKYIKSLRVIIDRNFSLRYLTNSTKWLNSPVLSVSSENAIAIMRLISYSYDDVVTYEDNANARIYRVYSKSNKDWFVECIKPNDMWVEGNMYFLKTDIPSVQK